jgi:putative membrane protein
MKRTIKDYAMITLKGIAMGAADVVPGVSGGTIAFIAGIYQELVDSIKSIGPKTLKMLFSFKIAAFWKAVNGNFLLSLVLGIAFSIFSLAKVTTWLLVEHPVLVWAFFFGLVLASTWFVLKDVGKWNWKTVAGFILGAGVAYCITVAVPMHTPEALPFIFLYGAIAICAMILPGISGSFILVLMDKYFYIMEAVKELKISIIITFASGAAIGLICFSRVLSFLLRKYHDITIAVLSGFMLGSLNKVWPWKETVETFTDSHGAVRPLVEANILPDKQLWEAIALAIVGFIIVYVLEKLSRKRK